MKRLDYYWSSLNFISMVLLPLAWLFCFVSKLRVILYHLKLLKSFKAPVPVIVVGNITVGGTGKTPLIIELVKQLKALGKKPCVISRGYGGASSTWPQVVDEHADAVQVGDEPKLIHKRAACPVVVGPNRQQDIELLLKTYNCDVILSDDGLQHYALQRDLEIVVVDAQRKFGNGLCLPSGPLREGVSRLQQVDMVVLNGGDDNQISFKLQPQFCLAINRLNVNNKLLADYENKTVHAIAGIGNPSRFFNMLHRFGIDVIAHEFSDHASYTRSDVVFNDDLPVLMTEKDAVKCETFDLPDHWSVPVDVEFSELAKIKLQQLLKLI
mgnify:CR=1 FL=1